MRSTKALVAVAAASAVVLTAASLALMALLGGAPLLPGYGTARPGCTAPALPGTVVAVTEADTGMMMGGPMRLVPDRATVPHGTVSFSAVNLGSVPHELLVLPLAQGQQAGTRAVGPDGRIDEAGSLGEASATCADGGSQGILPGAASWVTLDLAPGRYELLCDLPGHYLAGMHAEITVT